jgi:hypothetical protein
VPPVRCALKSHQSKVVMIFHVASQGLLACLIIGPTMVHLASHLSALNSPLYAKYMSSSKIVVLLLNKNIIINSA